MEGKAQQSTRRDQENQIAMKCLCARGSESDLRTPYGPAVYEDRNMRPNTCQHPTARTANPNILLAQRGMSIHVTNFLLG